MSEINKSQGDTTNSNINVHNGDFVGRDKIINNYYPTRPSITKDIFRMIFNLPEKQPWIKEKIEQLNSIINQECLKSDNQHLILSLLHKFEHVCTRRENEAFSNISKQITDIWNLKSNNTLLVLNHDNELKNNFNVDWQDNLIIHKKPAVEKLKTASTIANIVFFDNFIGTDTKSSEAYRYLINEVKNIPREINIFIVAICIMEQEKSEIDAQNIQNYAYICTERGISGDPNLSEYKNDMLELEKCLFHDTFLEQYSLGENKSEALFYYEKSAYNKHNFPIFWKSENHKQDIKRHVLLEL